MSQLRPDQLDLMARVGARFAAGHRSVLMQAGTGFGKTHTAAEMIKRATAKNLKTLFLAHLDALIEDTHERLTRFDVRAGFIQAGRATDPQATAQIASIQTMHSRGDRPDADLIILDECHRAESASIQEILTAYSAARLLGMTATPQRSDGKPLGNTFECIEHGPSNKWLTNQGFLVPCHVLAPEMYLEELNMDPVAAYEEHAPGTRAIVFATNVAHAEDLTRRFNEANIPAALITGETSRTARRQAREDLRTGRIRILVGVGVFIEGWDSPEIETVILARGFTVPGAFLQAIGRGLRPSPVTNKHVCTVIDLRGCVNLHGLPDEDRVWSLTGTACKRTEQVAALRRCTKCWAIFRPATECPRCGARAEAVTKLPRVLSRAEKMVRWEGMPQDQRDARYLMSLVRVAEQRMNMPRERALAWARTQFQKRFGRRPGEAA